MAEVAIDWSTADVQAGERSTSPLQLSVIIAPEPDSFWLNAFAEVKQLRQSEGRGEDWWANAPAFGTLTVGGVRPGSEDEVRAALDEMVAQANKRAGSPGRRGEGPTRRSGAT